LARAFSGQEELVTPEGISVNGIPFNVELERRAQQIYAPSLFPVLSEPGSFFRINSIAFRLNASSPDPGSSSAIFDQLQIYFSTSDRAFASGFVFGTPLDQNNGLDKKLSFNQQGVRLSGTHPAPGPAPFDIKFNLSAPYDYNPEKGSLVLEIWK
jgi:hypothetical protein